MAVNEPRQDVEPISLDDLSPRRRGDVGGGRHRHDPFALDQDRHAWARRAALSID
jgi:hypothetical protein